MAMTIFELAVNTLEAFIIYYYISKCMTLKKHHLIFDVLLIFACSFYLSLSLFWSLPPLDFFIILFPLLYSVFLSTDSLSIILYWNSVLILVFSLVAGIMSNTYLSLISLFSVPLYLDTPLYIFHIFLSNAILFWILHLITKQRVADVSLDASTRFIFLLMIAFMLLSEEALYYQKTSGDIHVQQWSLFLSYIGLIACTIISILLFHIVSIHVMRKGQMQTELALLSQTEKHQEELAKTYSDLIAFRHDMKHQLQALETMISKDNNAEAKNYLTEIQHSLPKRLFITGNIVVDALLSAKFSTMERYGIQFHYAPFPLNDLPISTVDFCSILGNLLDNAIEGILRIDHRDEVANQIHLSFLRMGDMFFITCENPCNPATIKKELSSSKVDHQLHGIGINSIRRIVSSAEGRYDISIKNDYFIIHIVLPYLCANEKLS